MIRHHATIAGRPTSPALRMLGEGLRGGVAVGVAAGLAVAASTVIEQHYVRLRLARLVLRTLDSTAALGLAAGAVCGLLLAFAVWAAAALLGRLPVRWRPRDAAGTALTLVALQLAAAALLLGLRQVPAWPPLRTPAGILGTGAVSLACVGLALVVAEWARGVHGALRRAVRALGARRVWLSATLCVGLLHVTTAVASSAAAHHAGRPNLLLVTIDTLRADHLGMSGYARDTSPEIDRLAREGVRFTNAVSQWPKTTPSLVSLHTSTYGRTHGVTRDTKQALPPGFGTLAERLSDAGYETAAVVTNANLGRLFHFDQGFDEYVEAWESPSPDAPNDDPDRAQNVTDHALAWLARRPRDRPFFLWVHYLDPHARYEPPPPYDGMFVGDAHYDGSRRAPLHAGRDEDMHGIPGRARLGDHDEVGYYVAQYDAEIRYTDHQVGRLLQAFDEAVPRDRAAVVLTADHGESLGEHGYYFEHGRLPYDDCVRVPLVIRGPGAEPTPRVVAEPVELIDVMPTLLAFAGLATPPQAEGRSLLPLLDGGAEAPGPVYAFTESGYTRAWQRSVRDARWKLVQVRDLADRALMTGGEYELYDTVADPGESVNLVAANPVEAKRLRTALEGWVAHGPRGRAAEGHPVPLDPETEERLRRLGYVE